MQENKSTQWSIGLKFVQWQIRGRFIALETGNVNEVLFRAVKFPPLAHWFSMNVKVMNQKIIQLGLLPRL